MDVSTETSEEVQVTDVVPVQAPVPVPVQAPVSEEDLEIINAMKLKEELAQQKKYDAYSKSKTKIIVKCHEGEIETNLKTAMRVDYMKGFFETILDGMDGDISEFDKGGPYTIPVKNEPLLTKDFGSLAHIKQVLAWAAEDSEDFKHEFTVWSSLKPYLLTADYLCATKVFDNLMQIVISNIEGKLPAHIGTFFERELPDDFEEMIAKQFEYKK